MPPLERPNSQSEFRAGCGDSGWEGAWMLSIRRNAGVVLMGVVCTGRDSLRRCRERIPPRHRSLGAAIVAVATVLAVSSCRNSTASDTGPSSQIASALTVGAAATASQIVAAIQAQPGSPVQSAVAQGFASVTGGLRPQFAAATLAGESKPAQVVLPALCNAALHLQDTTSGAAVDVTLKGALPVAAQTASGYVVYPGALAGGAVLHRALPGGSEDFVSLPARPATPEIDYSVALGKSVAGLRLVGGTLEMLDASGTPRLRVAPPYIVGADGISTDGALAVTDCFVDSDPTPPWGRTVTDPGASSCTVRVTWPDASVVYPAILDPRWTTTGSMIASPLSPVRGRFWLREDAVPPAPPPPCRPPKSTTGPPESGPPPIRWRTRVGFTARRSSTLPRTRRRVEKYWSRAGSLGRPA
jgi:hypothetical protein